jgi:hypothetical protein
MDHPRPAVVDEVFGELLGESRQVAKGGIAHLSGSLVVVTANDDDGDGRLCHPLRECLTFPVSDVAMLEHISSYEDEVHLFILRHT